MGLESRQYIQSEYIVGLRKQLLENAESKSKVITRPSQREKKKYITVS